MTLRVRVAGRALGASRRIPPGARAAGDGARRARAPARRRAPPARARRRAARAPRRRARTAAVTTPSQSPYSTSRALGCDVVRRARARACSSPSPARRATKAARRPSPAARGRSARRVRELVRRGRRRRSAGASRSAPGSGERRAMIRSDHCAAEASREKSISPGHDTRPRPSYPRPTASRHEEEERMSTTISPIASRARRARVVRRAPGRPRGRHATTRRGRSSTP